MVFLCLAVNLLKISYRTYFASSLLWLPVALWQFRHTDRSLNISVQAPVTATQNVAAYRGEGVGGGEVWAVQPPRPKFRRPHQNPAKLNPIMKNVKNC